jgi:hypothetical protein
MYFRSAHVGAVTRNWRDLTSRLALLLGLGALGAAAGDAGDARAAAVPLRVPQQSAKTFGDLLIWNDRGRIYVAESGGEPRELALGDTPEAHRLIELLRREGATAEAPLAVRDRITLVGGGGEGFHRAPAQPPTGSNPGGGVEKAPPVPNLPVAPPPQQFGQTGTAGKPAPGTRDGGR